MAKHICSKCKSWQVCVLIHVVMGWTVHKPVCHPLWAQPFHLSTQYYTFKIHLSSTLAVYAPVPFTTVMAITALKLWNSSFSQMERGNGTDHNNHAQITSTLCRHRMNNCNIPDFKILDTYLWKIKSKLFSTTKLQRNNNNNNNK